MKIPHLSIASAFASVFVLSSCPLEAALVEYTGNEVALAPWSLVGSPYSVDLGAESITFGPGAIWAEQPSAAPGSQWLPDPIAGFVEVTFQLDEGTINLNAYVTGLAIYTGTREWNVFVNEGAVTVNGITALPPLELDVIYTMRFDYDASGLDVSLDGTPLNALQDVVGLENGYAAVIYLHRFSSTVALDSQATFYDVSWSAVPEPGTFALLGGGAIALSVAAWRRRRNRQ